MLNLLKYKTPEKYSSSFKEVYSYLNVKQVKILSTAIFLLASVLRLSSFIFNEEMMLIPNYEEYNISNFIQLTISSSFIILSSLAVRPNSWSAKQRNLLTLVFAMFLLGISFFISYIYSMHNTKNTMMVFLIGIVIVCIFFSLQFRYIALLSVYIIALFVIGMIVPNLAIEQKILNIAAAIILAFVLYVCSRYGYYFKSQHFTQVQQLKERNLEVHELNRQKGEILGFVAHDLRNPLNNIEALSRILLEEDNYKESTELQLILSSARQAKHIINDLIEVAQEKEISFHVEETDMISYMKDICSNWQLNAEREINFYTTETVLSAAVNPSKFSRVIDNLIGNGVKFSKADTPIEINLSVNDNLCLIKIRDFGIGIPEQLQHQLFDQFSKAGRPGLLGEKSIGLGLHISKQIIEQHSGVLRVESRENEGTTFVVIIPMAS